MARTPKSDRSAVTSGQAAAYCFVSVGTIQNWVNAKQLQSQRTAGGQFRIRVDLLREFMLSNGMSVETLDSDFDLRPRTFCWEFFSNAPDHSSEGACSECVVSKTQSRRCFELRKHVEHKKIHCNSSCDTCAFHKQQFADLHETDEGRETE
jgi:excisionase family DNA binding protein